MTALHGQGPPASTIDDFVAAVKGTLAAVGALRVTPGDGLIEWLEGDRHDLEEGCPPRVFVLIGDTGALGPPLTISGGNIASIRENARFFVWGAETADDADRHRAAMVLAMRLINCFLKVAPGRIKLGRLERSSKTSIVTFGEEYQIGVEWAWSVPRDAAIWAVPVTPVSPVDPAKPNGDTGVSFDVTITADPSR